MQITYNLCIGCLLLAASFRAIIANLYRGSVNRQKTKNVCLTVLYSFEKTC